MKHNITYVNSHKPKDEHGLHQLRTQLLYIPDQTAAETHQPVQLMTMQREGHHLENQRKKMCCSQSVWGALTDSSRDEVAPGETPTWLSWLTYSLLIQHFGQIVSSVEAESSLTAGF